jgi:hypothetical protein
VVARHMRGQVPPKNLVSKTALNSALQKRSATNLLVKDGQPGGLPNQMAEIARRNASSVENQSCLNKS